MLSSVAGCQGRHQQAQYEERLRACLIFNIILNRVLQEVLELLQQSKAD